MATATGLKGAHDALLADKPHDAAHDPATCPMCATNSGGCSASDLGGAVTYTEEDLQAAVAKATGSLQSRIDELEQSQQTSEVESAKAAVRSEMQTAVVDLQSQLDEAVLKATAAEQSHSDLLAWLEGEATAQTEAAEREVRKDERLAKVREAANFPEEYLTKNADRFAAMSDEDFEIAVEGWKAIGGEPNKGGETLPTQTALHAGRESESHTGSAVKELIALRRDSRIDLATL